MSTGMLFLIDVTMENKNTNEITLSRFLIVADDESEISSRFTYQHDISDFENVRITNIQKIKQKIHLLSTRTEIKRDSGNLINKDGLEIPQNNSNKNSKEYLPKIFSIGIATTIVASDEKHAMRKIGSYLLAANTIGGEKTQSPLSENSKVMIEEVAKSSGFALPRDVSNESNRAMIFRG